MRRRYSTVAANEITIYLNPNVLFSMALWHQLKLTFSPRTCARARLGMLKAKKWKRHEDKAIRMRACVAAAPRFGDTNSDARPFKCIICALETFCGPFVYFNRPLYLDCVCVCVRATEHTVFRKMLKKLRGKWQQRWRQKQTERKQTSRKCKWHKTYSWKCFVLYDLHLQRSL